MRFRRAIFLFLLSVITAGAETRVSITGLTRKSEGAVLDLMGGATVPLAGGSVLASYIHHDDKGVLNHDASQWGLGYVYPLSKRTSLYTAYAHISNRNGATFTVGNATEGGTGHNAFDFGCVHNF